MFQSTFPQGERLISSFIQFSQSVFQSTFPQGERLNPVIVNCLFQLCFNPRSRKGNDSVLYFFYNPTVVSIHVPARGTTPEQVIQKPFVLVSIHVPARGTTRHAYYPRYEYTVSIHVPARGTTVLSGLQKRADCVSIHVPARGTTLFRVNDHPSFNKFQSTFPQGERL